MIISQNNQPNHRSGTRWVLLNPHICIYANSTRDVMFSVNRALLHESICLQSLRDEHQGCDVQCELSLAVWIILVTESEGWAPGMWCSVWTGSCCVNHSGYRDWGMSTRDVMFSVNWVLLCESFWLQRLRDEHQWCEESNKARTWARITKHTTTPRQQQHLHESLMLQRNFCLFQIQHWVQIQIYNLLGFIFKIIPWISGKVACAYGKVERFMVLNYRGARVE